VGLAASRRRATGLYRREDSANVTARSRGPSCPDSRKNRVTSVTRVLQPVGYGYGIPPEGRPTTVTSLSILQR